MVDIDFKYLDFYTYYSSQGDIEKELCREYCFSTIFDGDKWMNNHYELYIYRYGYKNNNDNNCLITKKQLIQHIEEIKTFYSDFDYTLISINGGYKIVFNLDCELMWHKVILSWIRYSYEFPFNVTLYEAFKVKKEKEFKNETILNLFNLIGATMGCTKHGTDIHCISNFYDFKKFVTYESFKERIEELIEDDSYSPINRIFSTYTNPLLKTLSLGLNFRVNNTDYWKDESQYKNRLDTYKHNLNILK
jgi:hypothetical protein